MVLLLALIALGVAVVLMVLGRLGMEVPGGRLWGPRMLNWADTYGNSQTWPEAWAIFAAKAAVLTVAGAGLFHLLTVRPASARARPAPPEPSLAQALPFQAPTPADRARAGPDPAPA